MRDRLVTSSSSAANRSAYTMRALREPSSLLVIPPWHTIVSSAFDSGCTAASHSQCVNARRNRSYSCHFGRSADSATSTCDTMRCSCCSAVAELASLGAACCRWYAMIGSWNQAFGSAPALACRRGGSCGTAPCSRPVGSGCSTAAMAAMLMGDTDDVSASRIFSFVSSADSVGTLPDEPSSMHSSCAADARFSTAHTICSSSARCAGFGSRLHNFCCVSSSEYHQSMRLCFTNDL
mmetsp:Transcript_13976/g.34496  ORF Transcript_13976/g.34496 Transcript_13976/m.34496 type:complete len:236 (-) Transcript_13976:729-1436(-)